MNVAETPPAAQPDRCALPIVRARGEFGAQGEAIGTATGGRIEQALDIYRARFRDEIGLSDEEQARLGGIYASIVSGFSPHTAQILDAMAETAGVERSAVYLLNARSEVLYGSSRATEADGACTTGAVLGTHTDDGRTYVLQNWDWRHNLLDQMYLLATEDPDGHRILSLAEAGMVAKAGINSAGIAVALNLLASDRNKAAPGVPVHVLLREVLAQRRMSSAISTVLQADREGSANLVLADDERDAIDLELVSDDFSYHLPVNGVITHANHFQVRSGWRDLYVDRAAFTLLRDHRLRRSLETGGSGLDLEAMKTALADHASYPDGICRHIDPATEPTAQVSTLCSMIMDTSTGSAHVSGPNPCSRQYVELRLDQLFEHTPTGNGR